MKQVTVQCRRTQSEHRPRAAEPWSQCHLNARRTADALGVPLAYLYADNDLIAEAILAFGLLSQAEQRKAVAELRERAFSQGSRKRG